MNIIITLGMTFFAYLVGRYSSISYYQERLENLRDSYDTLRRKHFLLKMEMAKKESAPAQSYWDAEDEFHRINHTE